ncbi:MAG TPA: hypothetical protein VE954_16500 [Oligoflexus sp.]|uniref:hypothetical protein n=1 Tax=Oligoflexus sp. TaxID=1971216 RepID=UPI002D43A88F|nr:hypothetical protein [Oligoflexus sp.]HYX34699.1 hypothetical protein [Oligoflexus sp.]
MSADEAWIIPRQKTVIFKANKWGANKCNVFGFESIRKQTASENPSVSFNNRMLSRSLTDRMQKFKDEALAQLFSAARARWDE